MNPIPDFGPIDNGASDALLSAFMDRVRANVRAQIMEAIKPDIDAAVDAAAASIHPALQSYVDAMKRDLAVKLTVEKKP